MTDDILAEIFRHNTAIHVADMFDDPDFNNPVAVGYCPIALQKQPSSFDPSDLTMPEGSAKYLSKAGEDLKEFISKYSDKIGDKAEVLYNAVLALLADKYNALMEKGHTAGGVVEFTGSVGIGGIGGFILAFDKQGYSLFGFAGLTAGATAGVSAAFGGMYYPGMRQGLQGWGGNFNASIAVGWIGAQWEATMTSGKTGHFAKYTAGAEIALSVELARTWLVEDKVY